MAECFRNLAADSGFILHIVALFTHLPTEIRDKSVFSAEALGSLGRAEQTVGAKPALRFIQIQIFLVTSKSYFCPVQLSYAVEREDYSLESVGFPCSNFDI